MCEQWDIKTAHLPYSAGFGSFDFTLSYLPHFNVVCASVCSVNVTGMSDEQVSTHQDKVCLLHCLLADSDTGRTSPNAIASFHIRKQGKEVFSSAVRTYGFPYKWVQNVCGINDGMELPFGVPSQQQVDISAESVEMVINKLKNRFKAQANLLRQVVPLTDDCKMLYEPEEGVLSICKLLTWKPLPLAEVQVRSPGWAVLINLVDFLIKGLMGKFVSHSLFCQQEKPNRFYQGMLQQEDSKFMLLWSRHVH